MALLRERHLHPIDFKKQFYFLFICLVSAYIFLLSYNPHNLHSVLNGIFKSISNWRLWYRFHRRHWRESSWNDRFAGVAIKCSTHTSLGSVRLILLSDFRSWKLGILEEFFPRRCRDKCATVSWYFDSSTL